MTVAERDMSVPELSPPEIRAAPSRMFIDVREQHEFDAGYISGAVHLSVSVFEDQIESIVPDYNTPLTLYCAGGVRSLRAGKTLKALGYTDVISMAGGINAWKQAGFECVLPTSLTEKQQERYSRHLLVPEIGLDGQRKLLDSSVLIIGAGGLGSPVALYLAAA